MTCIENPMVLVLCMTYNHEAYIEDALNGFFMQKTEFPFVVSIIDDASTDNNASVITDYLQRVCDADEVNPKIEEYGKVIDATPSNNPNCLLHVVFLSENHFGKRSKRPYYIQFEEKAKYIAMCEGDDYWTDPCKLQKQVDFLESHPDYSMCCHGADVLNETLREVDCACEHMTTREYFPDDAFPTWQIPTASIVYKKKEVDTYTLKNADSFMAGDVVLILKCMHVGRVWGMSEHMSVYRMNQGGATSQSLDMNGQLRLCRHYQALIQNFPKINTDYCHRYIAMTHYTNFRQSKKFIIKIMSLWMAIKNKPAYVIRKLLKINVSPRNDLFYQYYGQ